MVLNTKEAVLDLLDKRAKYYSDRPLSWMYHEFLGRKLNVFSISTQHQWFKQYRRLLNAGLNPRATESYKTNFHSGAVDFLRALSATPEKFLLHIRRSVHCLVVALY